MSCESKLANKLNCNVIRLELIVLNVLLLFLLIDFLAVFRKIFKH